MKPNLIRFLAFAAMMASWVYLPIFASDLGISDTEIGFIVAFYSLASFLSSFVFGRASDKYGRKLFLLVGLVLSAIVFFLQVFAQGFLSFGSLGWAFGSFISGLIAVYFAVRSIFIFSSLLFFLAFLTALKMRFGRHDSIDVPKFPVKIIRKNLPLYLSILIRHSGAQMIWTFWPLFLRSRGADLFWVGVISTINSITQFTFMYTLSGRIKYVASVTAGLVLSSVTFFSFTLATDYLQIIPTQFLLGASWALMYVGGLRYLMDRNIEKATVSGLFDSVLSLSSIIGPFMATFVITFGDYRTTMYLASILAFISFLVFKFSKQPR